MKCTVCGGPLESGNRWVVILPSTPGVFAVWSECVHENPTFQVPVDAVIIGSGNCMATWAEKAFGLGEPDA